MIRRRFLQLVAISSAGALTSPEAISSTARKTIVLKVKGFTCITCATGLDTLLGKEKGILSSHSTYPAGDVTVEYNAEASSEEAIRKFIAELGFTVESSHQA
ncbi:heavy-metal-associated domain-containing protein [Acidicapsa dinghuensis]|uniref:Heavy-metal-associated domain-containing protein n=1 Tax=Acidicapsa dinghuensis TaxID=2218256 RepID=A0ABW1EC56_9BACT|nr:heavy-metal-associated domain-containing protein [Acidicapsa dinghuensis]